MGSEQFIGVPGFSLDKTFDLFILGHCDVLLCLLDYPYPKRAVRVK